MTSVEAMFLVGHRIAHSLSPAMWNHLFAATGRPTTYSRRDVDDSGLDGVETEIRGGGVLAANVTMPHKAWAARIADARSADVVATGAANFLIPTGPSIAADNTDVVGARRMLEPHAPFERVLVLGAGGTAGALVRSLVGLATTIDLANRTRERAELLRSRFEGDFASLNTVAWEDRAVRLTRYDLVVSTVPAVDDLPIDPASLGSHTRVYDAVYRAEPTPFQSAVAARGLALADGLAHLAWQGIAMLEPLGIEPEAAGYLVEGLERATGRPVTAWGTPLLDS